MKLLMSLVYPLLLLGLCATGVNAQSLRGGHNTTDAMEEGQRDLRAKHGQGCSFFRKCGNGLSCHPFIQKCYHEKRREGEPCMAGHGCDKSRKLSCEAGSQRCRAPGQLRDPCHATRPCGDGFTCQPGVHQCFHKERREGQPCSAGFGCANGLFCEAGAQVCRAPGQLRDPCHATRPCGDGFTCQPGVHQCFHKERLEGEPCVAGFPCADGLTCEAGAHVCRAPGQPGDPCHLTRPCGEESFCEPFTHTCREFTAFSEALDDTLPALKEADPVAADLVEKYHPVFDYGPGSCFPAAMISRNGEINPGLDVLANDQRWEVMDGGDCRNPNFMEFSNIYHRYDRLENNGITHEVHAYELYTEKDQTPFAWSTSIGLGDTTAGHRNDWETIFIFFENNKPKYMGVSAHGDYVMRNWGDVPKTRNGHPEVVYFRDEFVPLTSALAYSDHGRWGRGFDPSFPALASWWHMEGDNLANEQMRQILSEHSPWTPGRGGIMPKLVKSADVQTQLNRIRTESHIHAMSRSDMVYADIPIFEFSDEIAPYQKTESPSSSPTESPSASPSASPSVSLSTSPSSSPTTQPTDAMTDSPTSMPSKFLSASPSYHVDDESAIEEDYQDIEPVVEEEETPTAAPIATSMPSKFPSASPTHYVDDESANEIDYQDIDPVVAIEEETPTASPVVFIEEETPTASPVVVIEEETPTSSPVAIEEETPSVAPSAMDLDPSLS